MEIVFRKVFINKNNLIRIIKRAAQKVFEIKNIDNFDISFLVTNNKEIKIINSYFRGINKPTDVLSFPSTDDFKGDKDCFYGDIAISINKAKSQARTFNQSLEKELSFLVIHGCLHLLGYNHENEKSEIKMRKEQRKILSFLQEKKY
jgi:probable rRNA maturation factor